MRWLVLLLLVGVAHADPPEGWLGRVTPGLGYSSGLLGAGGFSVGHALDHGIVIGGDAAITFGGMPMRGGGLAIASVLGPLIDWFPTRGGWHVLATAGIADLETAPKTDLWGIGGTLAVGHEWDGPLRAGFEVRVSAMRGSGHTIVAPALLFTIAFDSARR